MAYPQSDMSSNALIKAVLPKDTERRRKLALQVRTLLVFVLESRSSREGNHLALGLTLRQARLERQFDSAAGAIGSVWWRGGRLGVCCCWW